MSFGIFVPRRGEATNLLKSVGADWALDPSVAPMGIEILEGGPGDSAGTLIYFDRRGGSPSQFTHIDLARQRWAPASKDGELPMGRYHVGYWRDHPPGPDELVRADVVDGQPVTLRDGRSWIVPIADYLPKRKGLDRSSGVETMKPRPEDEAFLRKTNELFELMVSDEFAGSIAQAMEIVIPGGLRYAAEALGKNYRVHFDLLADDMLDLVGDMEACRVALVATGLALMAATDSKKNAICRALTS